MYKIAKNIVSSEPSNTIIRLSDNAYIPMSEFNIDYQKYLIWVSEGNTPEPADE